MSKINFSNLTMKDLLTPLDVEKLRDLWPHIKCSKCGELMIEPKMCISCNKHLCNKCHKANCNHEIIISRHLKSILENHRFRCKFFMNGCEDDSMYDYFKLKSHAENCSAFKQAYCNKSNAMIEVKSNPVQNELSSLLSVFDSKLNETTFSPPVNLSYKPITLGSLINVDKQDNNDLTEFTCNCGEIFSGSSVKDKFLKHKKICLQKKEYEYNQKEENKGLKEKLVQDFMVKIETLQNCFAKLSKQKHEDYINKALFEMNCFHNELEKKDENIKVTEEEIKDYYKNVSLNKDYIPEEILEKNKEYKYLINEENLLISRHKDLENRLIEATTNFNLKKANSEKELKNLAKELKNKLQQSEVEEKWLIEMISQYSPTIISSVFSDTDTCSLCKNVNVNIKKYYCQECRKRFCAGSCAKICSTSNCSKINKYICPECTPRCGLCRKNVFCSSCKKACFFNECKNMFCPDCYKRNVHQQRGANNNCAFFTCEVDKVKACLMTSLFCVKCEKRLCNNCLFNDKDHFSSLFK